MSVCLPICVLHFQENILTLEEEIVSLGGTAVAYTVDITSVDQIKKTAQKVKSDLGHVTILVNNAMFNTPNDLLRMRPDDARRIMDVNVMGQFWVRLQYSD